MKLGYALYLRKSQKDLELESLGEMETLAKHESLLRDLARKQGLNVIRVYKEIVSGESIDDRPEMQQLLADIYQGKYEGVLVAEVERLARGETLDQGKVANAFKYTNTKIITPSKTYDPNNEYDEEYFEFGLFMSRREFKTITRRMKQGKILSVKDGNFIGTNAPYGYDIVRNGKKDRTLVPNDKAVYVEMMFDWFVNERLPFGRIATKLTDMGIPTPRNNGEWRRMVVRGIIENHAYVGKVRWYRRKTSKEFQDGKLVKKSRRQSVDDYLIADGKHPAIISEEIFERAQEILKQKTPSVNVNRKLRNPLAGILKCRECGGAIDMKVTEQGHARYEHRRTRFCKMRSVRFEPVMSGVIQGLREHIADFEFKMTNEAEMENEKARVKQVSSIEKELVALEKQKQKQMDLLEKEVYSDEEFAERRAMVNAQIKTLETTLKELRSEGNPVDYTEKIATFKDVLDKLQDDTVEAKHKNDLLKDILEKIEYFNKEGEIELDLIFK